MSNQEIPVFTQGYTHDNVKYNWKRTKYYKYAEHGVIDIKEQYLAYCRDKAEVMLEYSSRLEAILVDIDNKNVTIKAKSGARLTTKMVKHAKWFAELLYDLEK